MTTPRPRIAVLGSGVVADEVLHFLADKTVNVVYVETPNVGWGVLDRIDLGILAWWPDLVRDPLLSLPRRGWLNMHPSLLPYNRGKHPNFWTLVDETPAGATLHFIDSGVDTGPIVAQESLPLDWTSTGESVYLATRQLCVDLFKRHFDAILDGTLAAREQPAGGTSHQTYEMIVDSHLDLDDSYRVRDLLNLLRARTFPPHPACWFESDGKRFEVRVSITQVPK